MRNRDRLIEVANLVTELMEVLLRKVRVVTAERDALAQFIWD